MAGGFSVTRTTPGGRRPAGRPAGPSLLDELVGRAWPLAGSPSRLLVPEPFVKEALLSLGVSVPRSVVADEAADASREARRLAEPLVVKAFGPGIVHKTELGAVRLGVTGQTVESAAAAMGTALAESGVTRPGFLVEEQATPGVELLVGVVRHDGVGPVALVGLGGTLTEILDQVSARLLPLSPDDAAQMLSEFRGGAALAGARGGPAVDRDALIELLLSLAGPDGLVARLGPRLVELECNPVIVSPQGALVADARLVLDGSPAPEEPPSSLPSRPSVPFDQLFAPRSIAVAGASLTRQTFGNRALAAYRSVGRGEGLWAIHPTATSVEGVPARPSLADLPEGGVDYLQVALPAAAAVELVRTEGPRAAVVQVISGGFAEAGPEGRSLEVELVKVARQAGVRMLGPNCMGVYCPAGRQSYLQGVSLELGRIGVVSQSGGLGGDLINYGARRGLRFSKVVSIGNAADVTPGEMLDHLADDPSTGVIGLYLEGLTDGERVVDALRRLKGRKPVVALVGGSGEQGRSAVATHTGSMAVDRRIWAAVSASTGITPVETLEDLVGCLAHHQAYAGHPAPGDPDVMVMGVGGGATVLAADACDRAGLKVTPLASSVQQRLREMGFGVGTSVVNPIEAVVTAENVGEVLAAILGAQPFPDVLLHVNVQAYYGYGDTGVRPLLDLMETLAALDLGSRPVVVARNLDVAPGRHLDEVFAGANRFGIPLYRTLNEAAVAIRAGKRFARLASDKIVREEKGQAP
jgi:acyl-CoA synthetase (NDP forming)